MPKTDLPVISVIIPVYNRFEMAKEAVSSVIGQTYRNFEIIIVDDGSIDMTPVIPTYFRDDERVRYIKINHSGMPGLVRNMGVKISKGKYLAFLDSDDLWMESKLEKQIRYLENNPEYKIVHTREAWIRNGKKISQTGFKHKRSGDIFKDALEKCIIGPSTVLIERELYNYLGGFRDDIEIAEDYELWLRLTDFNNIAYIDEPLITKRAGHIGQLSEKYGQIEIFRIRGLQKLVEQKYFSPDNQQMAEQELVKKCRIYAAGCRKRDKIDEAELYKSIAAKYGN
jgi:glycosyltransferase involved in cell wall biosynthesis